MINGGASACIASVYLPPSGMTTMTGSQRFLPHGVPQLHEDVTGFVVCTIVEEERIGHFLDVIIGTPGPPPPVLTAIRRRRRRPPPLERAVGEATEQGRLPGTGATEDDAFQSQLWMTDSIVVIVVLVVVTMWWCAIVFTSHFLLLLLLLLLRRSKPPMPRLFSRVCGRGPHNTRWRVAWAVGTCASFPDFCNYRQFHVTRVVLNRQFTAFYSIVVVCDFFRQTETP